MKKNNQNFFRIFLQVLSAFSRDPWAAAIHLKNISARLAAFRFSRSTNFDASKAAGPTAPVPDAGDNPLRRYFEANTEGPGIWKWDHYFEIYHRHLAKFVGCSAHLVEVGIYSGGSLQMWRSYFGSQVQIHGIDIESVCQVYQAEGIEISIGDQADRAFWSSFRQKAPLLDIVIDDGGHTPEQQRVTIEELLPHLRPGGVYICEDIHGQHNQFADYLTGYCNSLNEGFDDGKPGLGMNALQRWCHSIHFYPYLVVIEKRDAEQPRLLNSRRGTQWQPFFPEALD